MTTRCPRDWDDYGGGGGGSSGDNDNDADDNDDYAYIFNIILNSDHLMIIMTM